MDLEQNRFSTLNKQFSNEEEDDKDSKDNEEGNKANSQPQAGATFQILVVRIRFSSPCWGKAKN
jgi:hypothetical protein